MRFVVLAACVAAVAAVAAAQGRSAVLGLGPSWVKVSTGPRGGAVWQGPIPDPLVTWDHRPSAVYLPPGYSRSRRYPVLYLLHGMRGAPSSFWSGLSLAETADALISTGRTRPFIAVMPVAGPTIHPDAGEWAGVWERYLVQDVVPWVDAHLPTIAAPQGRALEGLCAGGFGAVDIGLRNPGIFQTLGSWEGYFSPVFRDGPFVHASLARLDAHDPALLVRRDAVALRRTGVRFYLAFGGDHGSIRGEWTSSFARELQGLRLPFVLRQVAAPRPHVRYWRSLANPALAAAFNDFGGFRSR